MLQIPTLVLYPDYYHHYFLSGACLVVYERLVVSEENIYYFKNIIFMHGGNAPMHFFLLEFDYWFINDAATAFCMPTTTKEFCILVAIEFGFIR